MVTRNHFVALLAINAALIIPGHLLAFNLGPSTRLLQVEVAVFSLSALLYGLGFIDFGRLFRPLWSRPLAGTAMICLGLVAIWTPANLILAAWLMGVGLRHLYRSAQALAEQDRGAVVVVTRKSDIEKGGW